MRPPDVVHPMEQRGACRHCQAQCRCASKRLEEGQADPHARAHKTRSQGGRPCVARAVTSDSGRRAGPFGHQPIESPTCANVTAWPGRRAAPRQIKLYARARATTVITFALVRRLQSMPRKEWGPRNRQSLLLLHPGQQQWSSNSVVSWLPVAQHKLLQPCKTEI